MEKPNLVPERHPSLPPGLNAGQLKEWLIKSALEQFTDDVKRYFSEDELNDHRKEGMQANINIDVLQDQLKEISKVIKKGTETAMTFTIPKTVGVMMLETVRRENSDFVKNGFIKEEITVYGIVNIETHKVEYFDEHGNFKRERPMTPSEKYNQAGMFQHIKTENGRRLDTETGEDLGAVGQ